MDLAFGLVDLADQTVKVELELVAGLADRMVKADSVAVLVGRRETDQTKLAVQKVTHQKMLAD
jgi:hypothetical protein